MKMRKFGREKEFRLRKFERKRSNGEEMKEVESFCREKRWKLES